MRSCYGRNIRNICRDAGVTDISQVDLSAIKINPVPAGEKWRIPFLQDLRETAQNNPGFLNTEDMNIMIVNVCCH